MEVAGVKFSIKQTSVHQAELKIFFKVVILKEVDMPIKVACLRCIEWLIMFLNSRISSYEKSAKEQGKLHSKDFSER